MSMDWNNLGFNGPGQAGRLGKGPPDEKGRGGVREEVRRRLMAELSPAVDSQDTAQVRQVLRGIFEEVLVCHISTNN